MLFLLVIKNLLRGVVHHTYLSIALIEPANTRYSEQFCVISRKGACTYTCFIKGKVLKQWSVVCYEAGGKGRYSST